jgi:peptidoglycan hydrolase-like protein with peptidoglycan-binding domain
MKGNMGRRSTTARVAACLAAVVVTAACSGDDNAVPAGPVTSSTTTSTSTTLPPTTTSTTTTIPPAARIAVDGLAPGMKGEAVLALEQRLIELHFDPGAVDGTYDSATGHAVMAFQKLHGLERTSRATTSVLDAITTAQLPGPFVPGAEPDRVEVDLPRQVLILWKGGQVFRIVDVSTGTGKRYCVDGECARAVTPGGSFRVSRRISGWRTSRLGKLYNPLYFNGGIAIHGAPSVPGAPASHGCVRIPMYISYWFPSHVPNGTPVYVTGGKAAPVPFNEQAPPVDGSSTTTSSSSTSSSTSTSTTTTTAGGVRLRPTTTTPSSSSSSSSTTSTTRPQ